MSITATIIYRFGAFEVNTVSGELLKHGVRVKLQDQPFRLLVLLLENAGELVSHAEVQRRLWDSSSFGEFDSGVRVAVRKLRDALGDDADNPHYIATEPRKGYRFLGPVVRTEVESSQSKPAGAGHAEENDATALAVAMSPATAVGSRKQMLVMFAVVAAVAVIGISAYLALRRTPPLTDKDTIVLADFKNTTGDAVFNQTLRQGLAVQLQQSPFLSLVSEQRIQQVLTLMNQSPDAVLTPEIAQQVCERTGSTAVLDGSISLVGSHYVLGLEARNCQTGEILAEDQMQALRKEDVLNVLSEMGSRFRKRVGESLATVEKHNTPLAEATTPSLEALKAYSLAWKAHSTNGDAATIPLLRQAIELDPNFAMAYATLGRMYGDLGESELSAESTSKAYALRERTSDVEKLFIGVSYELQVTGNLEKARQTCDAWIEMYPRDKLPHAFLSGVVYPGFGEYDKAVEEGKHTIALDPQFPVGYLNLAYAYTYLERFGDAKAVLKSAAQNKLAMPDLLVLQYDLAFLQNDVAAMQQVVTQAQTDPAAQVLVDNHEAFALAYAGRLKQAESVAQRATELTLQQGQKEQAALFVVADAVRSAFFGDAERAKHQAQVALQLSNNRDVEYGAAFASALAGDTQQAESLASDLEKRFPEDTSVRFSYLPTLHAEAALNHRDAAAAMEGLQVATAYELGAPRSSFHGFFGALYPVFVRGQAYLLANQPEAAAAEFQKVLDHRGIIVSDPVGAAAQVELARALALAHDHAAAKKGYENFFSLWRDADPEIPLYRQAKREYAALR